MRRNEGMKSFKAAYRQLVRSLPTTFALTMLTILATKALLAAGDGRGALIVFGVGMTMLTHRFAFAIFVHTRACLAGHRAGLQVVNLRQGLRAYRRLGRAMLRNASKRWLPA